jgi:signal transduction histidine kinase
VLDLTERKRAEAEARESERRYREVRMELAHANRVATMGQLGVRDGPLELLISTARADLGGVLVVVRDSGPGLAPATLEHLFEAFYTTKPAGLGMGLSICRSIIEAHGGRLWAEATEPRGTSFKFLTPTRP